MIHTYTVTLNHHFRNAWGILIFVVGFSLAPLYLTYRHGDGNVTSYYIVCLGFFLLLFIPQVVLHLTYYRIDKGKVFSYTSEKQKMSLHLKDGRTLEFSFDQIDYIEHSKSIPLAENRMLWFPWDSYNYSIIRLKSGQQFILTSLLVPNMKLPFDEQKIRLRKRFYCYPLGTKEIFSV